MTIERPWTVKDVADRLGVAEPTLRWWRHKGVGPTSFKMGRRVVYRSADVEAWLEAQYASSRGDAA